MHISALLGLMAMPIGLTLAAPATVEKRAIDINNLPPYILREDIPEGVKVYEGDTENPVTARSLGLVKRDDCNGSSSCKFTSGGTCNNAAAVSLYDVPAFRLHRKEASKGASSCHVLTLPSLSSATMHRPITVPTRPA